MGDKKRAQNAIYVRALYTFYHELVNMASATYWYKLLAKIKSYSPNFGIFCVLYYHMELAVLILIGGEWVSAI